MRKRAAAGKPKTCNIMQPLATFVTWLFLFKAAKNMELLNSSESELFPLKMRISFSAVKSKLDLKSTIFPVRHAPLILGHKSDSSTACFYCPVELFPLQIQIDVQSFFTTSRARIMFTLSKWLIFLYFLAGKMQKRVDENSSFCPGF